MAIGLLERVWESSIVWHVWLVLWHAELSQETVLRVVFTVSRNKHWRKNWKVGGGERERKTENLVQDHTYRTKANSSMDATIACEVFTF